MCISCSRPACQLSAYIAPLSPAVTLSKRLFAVFVFPSREHRRQKKSKHWRGTLRDNQDPPRHAGGYRVDCVKMTCVMQSFRSLSSDLSRSRNVHVQLLPLSRSPTVSFSANLCSHLIHLSLLLFSHLSFHPVTSRPPSLSSPSLLQNLFVM